jgi:hypothetical protein
VETVYEVHWLFMSLYLIVFVLDLLCIAEYLYVFRGETLSSSSRTNILGLALVAQSAAFMACYLGNFSSIASGGYTAATNFSKTFSFTLRSPRA